MRAADLALGIKAPMDLARKFGSSVYASVREFARTNRRACVVYVLEPVEYVPGDGARAVVRRIIPSPSFELQFGTPSDTIVTPDHVLGDLLPIGNPRMVPATEVRLEDLNGDKHECLAEAFKTQWNVFVLVYPVKALTSTTIILSTGT